MRKSDVLSHYGTQQKVAEALTAAGSRISQRAISRWGEIVPLSRAIRLEELTDGELKVDPSMYPSAFSREARA